MVEVRADTGRSAGMATIVAVILCSSVCSADLQVLQLPKNLQAKQSSVWMAGDNANFGNNGDTSGAYATATRCVHAAGGDTAPWWMLDMQTVRLVSAVRLWNRLDCCSEKISNVLFGATAIDSVWSSFNNSLIDQCYLYTGVPTATQNPLSFYCSRPVAGRYLTVQRSPPSAVYFHFCEIDVYVFTKSAPHRFHDVEPTFSTAAAPSLAEIPASRSPLECSLQCGAHPTCLYALHTRTGGCRLFLSPALPPSLHQSFISEGGTFSGLIG